MMAKTTKGNKVEMTTEAEVEAYARALLLREGCRNDKDVDDYFEDKPTPADKLRLAMDFAHGNRVSELAELECGIETSSDVEEAAIFTVKAGAYLYGIARATRELERNDVIAAANVMVQTETDVVQALAHFYLAASTEEYKKKDKEAAKGKEAA